MATTTDAAARPAADDRLLPTRMRPSRGRRWTAWTKHLLLIIGAVVMLYPLIWMLAGSFKNSDRVLSDPGLIPNPATVANYGTGWTALGLPFWVFFANSAIVAVCAVIGNVLSCALAAYAFARLSFRLRHVYFSLMLATIMLPYHAILVPQYIMFSTAGLVNTYGPLVIPKFLATDAFFIFLMVQFIRSLPRELDQAAALDGCGAFRTFGYVILPLMRPALATSAIFAFIWSWNDFLGPLIYLTRQAAFTAPVAINSMLDSEAQSGWGGMFAMSLLSLLPVIAVFVFLQKYLIRGISTTGIK